MSHMIISVKFYNKILVYCTKSPRVRTLVVKARDPKQSLSLHLHHHPSPLSLTLPLLLPSPGDTLAVSLATPFLVPLEKCSGGWGKPEEKKIRPLSKHLLCAKTSVEVTHRD